MTLIILLVPYLTATPSRRIKVGGSKEAKKSSSIKAILDGMRTKNVLLPDDDGKLPSSLLVIYPLTDT